MPDLSETEVSCETVRKELVTPPLDGPGICRRCRTWNDVPSEAECSNCADVRAVLGAPALPLSVVTLYRKPSRLRDWLTYYKHRETTDEDGPPPPDLRPVEHITTLLHAFLTEHLTALEQATGGFDVVVVVPSTERPPPHPLEELLTATTLGPTRPLLVRTSAPMGFRRPATDGYFYAGHRAISTTSRVLLLDDVYTTGARLNSAAFTLKDAGHTIAGALVLARRINPSYHEDAQALWDRQVAASYDWATSPYIHQERQ